jgi:hypothetical protein
VKGIKINIMKPTKHSLKKEGSRRGGNGNITEQVNLFNVYGTEV